MCSSVLSAFWSELIGNKASFFCIRKVCRRGCAPQGATGSRQSQYTTSAVCQQNVMKCQCWELKMTSGGYGSTRWKSENCVRSCQKGISLSRGQFCKFCKKVKPRISFDFDRLLYWAFAKLNPLLIFDFWSIRPVRATKTHRISVLIFDFCPYKGGP